MDDMNKLKKLNTEESAEVFQRISAYECSDYVNYKTDCAENRDMTFGNQWTETEKETIEARGQYALIINKLRKAINGIVGLMTASHPKFRVVPVGRDDAQMAALASMLNDWVWSNSGGLQTFRKAVKRGARDNIGYLHVIYSKDGKVKFVPLSYDDVVVDPNSKDPLFDDAYEIFITKWVPIKNSTSALRHYEPHERLYGDAWFSYGRRSEHYHKCQQGHEQ